MLARPNRPIPPPVPRDDQGRPILLDAWGNPIPDPARSQAGQPNPEPVATPSAPFQELPPTPIWPQPQQGGGGGGGDLGGGAIDFSAPFTQQFVAPTPMALPDAPTFQAPAYTPPPAFSYGQFQGPNAAAVLADPGYQFRTNQANQAFMQNRAAQQTAHTGGTIKDFLDYSQNAASQEYGNVWNRDYQAYGTNRANALDAYNTNYKTQYQDPWQMADTAAQQAFAPKLAEYQTNAANIQHENDLRNQTALNKWYQDYAVFSGDRNRIFDQRFKVATA
jgi:hypothetical protein